MLREKIVVELSQIILSQEIIKSYFLTNFLLQLSTLLKLIFLQVFLKSFAKLRVYSYKHLIHVKYLMASYNSLKLLLKRRWSCSFFVRGKSTNSAICGMKSSVSILHGYKIWIWMLDVMLNKLAYVYLVSMFLNCSTCNCLRLQKQMWK